MVYSRGRGVTSHNFDKLAWVIFAVYSSSKPNMSKVRYIIMCIINSTLKQGKINVTTCLTLVKVVTAQGVSSHNM